MLREAMFERLREELLRGVLVSAGGAALDVGLDGSPGLGGELPALESEEERAHLLTGHRASFRA
jgi:hypothetical protein